MSYVVVRVWVSRFRKMSPGHVSLAITPKSTKPEDGYVSFAPAQQGRISGPGRFYSSADDYGEYVQPSDDPPRGCWIGKIYGLDAASMLSSFQQAIKHPTHYSPFNECATQVHRYLVIGGADRFASRWSRNVIATWSPDDVEDYAKSIVHHTRGLGSVGHKFVGAGTIL